MTSRYQELYRIEKNLYLEGSPVLIEAGALQKDIVDDRVLAQVKLRNISNKRIIACKVCIWAYEISGAELEGIASFSYLDIAVKQGQDFGTKTPIYLPDNTTRRFDVAVIEIVFDDGIVWSEEPAEWIALPAQNKVAHVINDFELAKQYGLEAGANSSYYPELTMGLFLCTCGAMNIGGENARCYKCGRTYSDLIKILDVEDLTNKCDERVKKEEEKRRIEREQKEKKKAEEAKLAAKRKAEKDRIAEKNRQQKKLEERKRKRVLCISIPTIVTAIIIVILFPSEIKPGFEYIKATRLLKNGEYDEARKAFDELGTYRDSDLMSNEAAYQKAGSCLDAKQYEDATEIYMTISGYKDSDDLAKEAQYRKAESLYFQGDYGAAIAMWKVVSPYSDSSERALEVETELNEINYQTALKMMDEADYIGASDTFVSLGDYSDSVEKSKECLELQKEKEYQAALQALDENDKEKAVIILDNLRDYKDAEEICEYTAYSYAKELAEAGDYKNAVLFWGYSSGYEDSDSLSLVAVYSYGCQLLDEKKYVDAITQFENCQEYKGSNEKLNEAKYSYVQEHLEKNDSLTYRYLKDLVHINYPGAKSTFNDLYGVSLYSDT